MRTFIAHLVIQKKQTRNVKIFKNKREANDFVFSLKQGSISRYKKSLPLKNYGIWATWNLSAPDGIPFEFCNTNIANEIRINMGLDIQRRSRELILFVYQIPTDISLRKPTIADAELSQYFEPPPPSFEDHGLTVALKFVTSKKEKQFNIDSRPEGIHSSIELACVKLPIETRC